VAAAAGRPARAGAAGEEAADLIHEAVVIHVAGRRDHDVAGVVQCGVDPVEVGRPEAGDSVLAAQDAVAVGVALPEAGGVQVEHQVVGRVLDRGDLLQYHLPLQLQVLFPQERIQHQVAEDVQRQVDVLVEHPGLETGVLARVYRRPASRHPLEHDGDLACPAWRCP